MTPDQIKQLAEQIVEYGVPTDWKTIAIMAAVVFIAGAVGAYTRAFFGKRGDIDSVQRQLDVVIKQQSRLTEAIEHEKSRAWVEQRQWDLKRDIYLRMIEVLAKRQRGLGDVTIALRNKRKPTQAMLDMAFSPVAELVTLVHQGRMFLGQSTIDALARFSQEEAKLTRQLQQSGKDPGDVPYADRLAVAENLKRFTADLIDALIAEGKVDLEFKKK